MKGWMTLLLAGTCACVAPLFANRLSLGTWDDGLDVHETEEVQRSFGLTGAGPWRLTIDNLTGSIRVAASDQHSDQPSVELSVTKVIAARSAELVATARQEVTLEMNESPAGVDLYVDGPFRCSCGTGVGCNGTTTARGSC